jgi:hypothetical protein
MAREWVMFALFALIAYALLKINHHTRKWRLLLIVFLGFLLYFSIMVSFQSNNVDLSSPLGVVNAGGVYLRWAGNSVLDLWDAGVETTTVVGNAIKIDG